MGQSIRRSTDGGKTFEFFRGAPGGDDYHFLWIDPEHPERMIAAATRAPWSPSTAARAGAAGTTSRPASSTTSPPTTASPTGSTAASRTAARWRWPAAATTASSPSATGIRWAATSATTTSPSRAIPTSSTAAASAGASRAGTRRTGQVAERLALADLQLRPAADVGAATAPPGSRRWRSRPLPPHAIYLGAQVLFRSTDRGQTLADGQPGPLGAVPGDATDCATGDVPVSRARACGFGVISTIAPSPIEQGPGLGGHRRRADPRHPRRRQELAERHAARPRRMEPGGPDRRLGDLGGHRLRRGRPPPAGRRPPLPSTSPTTSARPGARSTAGLPADGCVAVVAPGSGQARASCSPAPAAASSSPSTTASTGSRCSSTCRRTGVNDLTSTATT